MITGAVIVAIPDAVFLFAMRRADARIHVEQDTPRRTATMNAVDPFAGKISERRKVLFRREPARLEAAHLARRSRCIRGRLSADYPPHRGIMAQALSVVHIFISGKSPKYGLPQHPDQSMSAILAGAGVRAQLTSYRRQPEAVVESAIGEQSCVGGDHRSSKLEHQPAVEIESENLGIRFTRRVRHGHLTRSRIHANYVS